MKISKTTFNKTSSWLKRNARSLEVARWEYMFEGASRDRVIHYLSAFQNKDGGFGHGIEPDYWLPESSAIATWTAGKILLEIEAETDEKIVQSMLSYLVDTCQKETGMWLTVLPENNLYPHAPWWHWSEEVQENWMFNPGVELAAYLVHWSPVHSEASQLGWKAIEKAIDNLMSQSEMGQHEINNYQQMVKLMKLRESEFNHQIQYSLNQVLEKVILLAEQCVDRDVSSWSTGYKALPLDFVDSPEDPLCNQFGHLVEQNLDFYIHQLSQDGTWDISWSWDSYPEEFAVARRDWKGILAVRRYKILKSFGYLEY